MKTNVIRKKPYHLKLFWNCFHTTYVYKSLNLKVNFEVENDFTTSLVSAEEWPECSFLAIIKWFY